MQNNADEQGLDRARLTHATIVGTIQAHAVPRTASLSRKISDMHMRTSVLGTILFGTVIALGGCKSGPEDVSFKAIKGNLTPELRGVTERNVDIQRNMAVTNNQNMRMMWGELGRMWLFDKPSRLSPYDIIATSGQPGQ